MRAFRGWLVFAGAVLLSGCWGRGDIRVVKDSVWTAMPDTTIGKALDSRSLCKSTGWRAFDDERKRRIVEYTCEYKGVKEYLARENQRVADQYGQEVQRNLNLLEAALKRAQDSVRSLRQGRDLHLSTYTRRASEDEARHKGYQADLEALEGMRDCRAFQMQSLRTKDEAKRLERLAGYRGCPGYDLEWSSLVRRLQEGLQDLGRSEEKRRQYMAEDEDAIARAEATLATIESQKPQQAKEVQEQGAAAQAEFQSRAAARLNGYQSLRETTQWSIVNGEPVHVGSAVELKAGDQTFTRPVLLSFVISEARDGTPEIARRGFLMILIDELWSRYR